MKGGCTVFIGANSKCQKLTQKGKGVQLFEGWTPVTFYLKDSLFHLLGVHIPPGGNTREEQQKKKSFWNDVLGYAVEKSNDTAIIAGDYNEYLQAIDTSEAVKDKEGSDLSYNMHLMKMLKWEDAWRKKHPHTKEYTHEYSKGKCSRLDYAYITSKLVNSLEDTKHMPGLKEVKRDSLSDHAALAIEFDINKI